MVIKSAMTITMDAAMAGAVQILHRYHLCDRCMGRLFARQLGLLTYENLGRRLKAGCVALRTTAKGSSAGRGGPCYVCRGLCDEMPRLLGVVRNAVAEYEFDTFSIGAIIKPSIMDRDDQIRSEYRLRGADGIKAGLTRELGRGLARITRSRQDRYKPDVSITIRPAASYCDVFPKPVAVYGRYEKHSRGTPQKQDACRSCLGYGCSACEYHGILSYDSVEGQISKFLFDQMGGTTARFTWIGGEDADSLVSGCGRPFFARIHRPLRRRIVHTEAVRLDTVSVSCMHDVPLSDVGSLRFSSDVVMHVESGHVDANDHTITANVPTTNDIDDDDDDDNMSHTSDNNDTCCVSAPSESTPKSFVLQSLHGLRRLSGHAVNIETRRNTTVKKMIQSLRYRRSGPSSFVVRARVDGGMPIKRLVTGDGVWPNISDVIGVPCRCVRFDFEDVHVRNAESVTAVHLSDYKNKNSARRT